MKRRSIVVASILGVCLVVAIYLNTHPVEFSRFARVVLQLAPSH
jgi:hypothetical protein